MDSWDPMELPDPLDQPDRITPDQEEAEDTDISDIEDDSLEDPGQANQG